MDGDLPEVTDYPMGPPGGGDIAPKQDDGDQLADQLVAAHTAVSDADPAQAAKQLRLSEKTGISPQDIHGNEAEASKIAAAPTRLQFKEIALKHPVVGKFLSDPVNMAQAYDDTPNLVAHSHANKELERSHGIADAIATGLENSILGMTFRNKTPDMALGDDATFSEKFAATGTQFSADFPFMALGGAVGSVLGPWGSAAGGFALPDMYRTALKQHMESGDEASAVDFAKQFFTLNSLKAGLKGSVLGIATAGAGKYALLGTGGKLITMGGQEAIVGGSKMAAMGAEATAMTMGGAALEGKKPTLDDAASNVLLMGLMHGAGVLGEASLDRAFPQRVADTVRVDATRDAAALLDQSSKASKLRARDPEGFEKLMNIGKPVMVPVEKFESYFQNKGIDPGQVSNDLGAAESYEYARQHGDGASVIIPQGKWLGEGMDSHRSALADDIKFNQDHLTANEYKDVVEKEKVFRQQRDEFIQKNGEDAAKLTAASEPVKAAHADITFDVRQRLEATKQFPQNLATPEARASWLDENSKLVADYFIAESSRRKVDPRQLYAQEGPRLTGGGAAARAASSLTQEPGSEQGGTPSEGTPASPENQPGKPSDSTSPNPRELGASYYTRPELQTRSSTWSITDNPDLVKASREERFNALLADEAKAYKTEPTDAELPRAVMNRARNNIQSGYKALAEMRNLPQSTREKLLHSMQRDQERLDLLSGIHPNAHVDVMGKPLIESPVSPSSLYQDSPLVPYKPELADASYSKLMQTLDQKIQGKTATVEQVKALASNFKEDERKWTGFDKFMADKSGKIDKSELLDFMKANRLQVEERVLGEPMGQDPELAKQVAAPNENGIVGGVDAFKRWVAQRPDGGTYSVDALQRQWAQNNGDTMPALVRMFSDEHPDLMQERDTAAEPTADDFMAWAADEASGEPNLNRHSAQSIADDWANRDRHADYGRFLEDRRVAAGGNPSVPSVDTLDDEELEEKVKEQYEDEISERSNEIESDNIDNSFSDWGVTAAERETDWGDVEIDDVEEDGDGKFTVHLNGASSIEIEAADEDGARQKAEKMINDGSDEIELNKYWTLEQGGNDYRANRYDHRAGRSVPIETWFESEREAQQAADDASDRERENMYGNSDGSEYREATDEIVQEVRDGERPLDGYENGAASKKAPKKREFKWDKARYESRYVLPGAEPGSVREIVFHAPQLEAYNATDKTHFGDISEGKEIGWTRTAIHKDDKGVPVRLANEFHNNRTQKGAAEGFKSDAEGFDKDEWHKRYKASVLETDEAYSKEMKAYSDAVGRLTPEQQTAFDKLNDADERRAFLLFDSTYRPFFDDWSAKEKATEAIKAEKPNPNAVPDTPFKNNSYEFQFKRLLRWHVEQDYKSWQASGSGVPFVEWWKKNGIKQLAWTTGMQQAERNNRVEDVDKLVYDPVKQELSAFKNGVNKINGAKMKPEEIAEKLGGSPQAHEIVKRLLATKPYVGGDFSDADMARRDELQKKIRGAESIDINQDEAEELGKLNTRFNQSSENIEHVGSHVIHDEGGIKVANNANFYQQLYDQKIPSFVKKFSKQWGGTVGEAMIKTGEQEGKYRYDGDEPGLMKLEKVGREIAGEDNKYAKRALAELLENMKTGRPFSELMADGAETSTNSTGYHDIAKSFGGKMVKDTASRFEKVHALEVTPEMARAAITQGFPLFQGEGANPQGEYVPATNTVHLHKGSDETTFMHEFAHGALEHMFKFVKSGQADAAYMEHFGAMKDFLDIKDDQESLTREQHEKFARGWERYLRGEQDQKTKAPTRELQGAYDQFRKWFTKAYKQIAGSPIAGNLTPEARGFFDRMVASPEQIEQAAQESGYKDGEIANLEGIDPATQQRHRTLQERARDKAENTMLKDNMADLQAERKVALDQERERQTKRIEPEVAEHPLYRASQDVEENRPGAHRSAASLSDDFLAGKLSAQEQGAFESAAEVHGFSDGRDLAESIKADAEKGGQAGTLKRRVDEAMKPFDQNSDALKEAALKAIHETQMTELLALEQQILSDMQHDQEVRGEVAKRRRVSASMAAADAKQQAKEFLASRPLKDAASFRAYITAERKAAVKVSQAVADGDFEEAAKAKGQQMLNHALAAEAMKNKAEINKKGKFLDKFIKRGQDMLNMPYGFVTKIDDMLVSHGLMDPRDPAMQATLQKNAEALAAKGETPADIANATGLVQDASGKWARETLPGFVARVNNDYYPISLPDSVMSATDSLHQKNPNMTLAELRDLHEAVKIVNAVGTGFERYMSDFVKGDIKVAAAQFKKQVEENIGTPHGNVPALGELDMNKLERAVAAIKALPDGFIADKVNLLTLSEYLDRLAPDGEAKKNIYRPLRGAENDEIERRADASTRLEAIREKHYTKDEVAKMGDQSLASWEIQTPDGPKKVRLTKENVMVMLLNRGSESNLDRLTRGFGVDAHKIQEITDLLDKRDHDFAQDVWHFVDSFWPEASALEMKVNGMEPKKVKAQAVESRHGTYEGGYYPLAYDFEKSADAYKNAEQRNALYKQFSTAAAHTEQGALKERVKTLDRPVRLTFDGLFNHLDNVIHDLAYRPSVIDVSRFLNQPDAKNAIVNAIGIDGYKKIGDDLKAAASAQGDFLTAADKKMRWFRFSTTLATLGYRLAVFPRRMTEDVVNSMREVGFRNSIGSAADYIMNPTQTRDFVREKSPLMRDRAVNRERDLMDMSRQWSGNESKIKQFAFMQDTIADQAMSYPVWQSVYNTNVAEHGETMAAQLADEAIIKTFGSGAEIDKVGAQRGSELNKLVSMYYSWHSMMFNRAWLQGKIAGLEYNEQNYGKAMAIIAATTATTWVIPAATDILWKEVLHNAPNAQEDDDQKKKRRIAAFAEAPFAYFPIARAAAAFTIPLALGEHPHGGYQLSPAESAIESVLKTVGNGAAGMFDPDKHYDSKFMEEAARTASIMLGSPQQLVSMMFNFKDYLDGEGELTWRDLVSRRAKK